MAPITELRGFAPTCREPPGRTIGIMEYWNDGKMGYGKTCREPFSLERLDLSSSTILRVERPQDRMMKKWVVEKNNLDIEV
jgi:hypothetical protein